MTPPDHVKITNTLSIPESELDFETSPSSGPGGQRANKVETRVTLRFDVEGSPSLDEARREKVRERLGHRMDSDGVLRITSQRHRSQHDNRKEAVERFAELMGDAFRPVKKRKPTRPSRGAKRRRLKKKRERSEIKQLRKSPKVPKDY